MQTGRRAAVAVAAGKAPLRRLEGASDELRAAAAQSLDWAPARRPVRGVFAPVLPTLDHCMFKKIDPDAIDFVHENNFHLYNHGYLGTASLQLYIKSKEVKSYLVEVVSACPDGLGGVEVHGSGAAVPHGRYLHCAGPHAPGLASSWGSRSTVADDAIGEPSIVQGREKTWPGW